MFSFRIPTPAAKPNAASQSTTTLKVTGMTCGSCANHVAGALESVEGVAEARVKLREGLVEIRHDGTAATGDLVLAVEMAGYGASEV